MSNYHPPLPRDNIRTPRAAIEKLINSKIEHLYAFKNGKQILRFQGDKDKVAIENIHLFKIKDAVVVHNHPGRTSFSVEDIFGLVKYDAKEGILVTKEYTYHIYRPTDGWNIEVESEEFLNQFELCKGIASLELEKAIVNGEILLHEKEIEIIHYIWMFLFMELKNIRYVRKKITYF